MLHLIFLLKINKVKVTNIIEGERERENYPLRLQTKGQKY